MQPGICKERGGGKQHWLLLSQVLSLLRVTPVVTPEIFVETLDPD